MPWLAEKFHSMVRAGWGHNCRESHCQEVNQRRKEFMSSEDWGTTLLKWVGMKEQGGKRGTTWRDRFLTQ